VGHYANIIQVCVCHTYSGVGDGGWYVQRIHHAIEESSSPAMLMEARPHKVDAKRTQRWPVSSSHISCDHKMFFAILARGKLNWPQTRVLWCY
jgi:hypothetical protein